MTELRIPAAGSGTDGGRATLAGNRSSGGASWVVGVVVVALVALALWPLAERFGARLENRRQLAAARAAVAAHGAPLAGGRRLGLEVHPPRRVEPVLATWGSIGGCGVGGAAGGGGQIKWVGRGVTGGRVDVQSIVSQTFYTEGGYQTALNTRLGTTLRQRWLLGLSVPFVYNVQDVDVFGQTKTARLPGFGDLSFEAGRKLGTSRASTVMLSLTAPTGAEDAARQGVLLPRQQQLGTGTLTGSLSFEHTRDQDWGLVLLGASTSYGGWENKVGDRRASTGSAYGYVGYILGRLVPSLGLSLTGKFYGDRERYQRPGQAMFLTTLSGAVEWAFDWVALLLSGSTTFATSGLETWTVGLGVQTSLF